MDEEILLADPLSYSEDIPYEKQVEEFTATSPKPVDLKRRIGNRIYLIEDALTKKRKRLTEELEELDDSETIIEEDMADPLLRPNALLLRGLAISQMPTDKVFAYATHFDAHPIGLEWVDDQTCVLVFPNRKSALHAWDALQRPSTSSLTSEEQMQLDDTDQSFRVAHALPLTLYPVDERISSALGKSTPEISKQPIQTRWARKTDVKERGARDKSQFYRRFGETAGKPANKMLPGYQLDDARQNNSHHRDEAAQLDADMDSFLRETNGEKDSLKQRIGNRKRVDTEERRRQLDDELDRFLAGEEGDNDAEEERNPDRPPSLLERTGRRRSASPRQRNPYSKQPVRQRHKGERGETRVHTDSEGRWLHNAEIAQRRRRMEYNNDNVFGGGMRAWDDDDGNGTSFKRPVKKSRKSASDLDRELEEFGERG